MKKHVKKFLLIICSMVAVCAMLCACSSNGAPANATTNNVQQEESNMERVNVPTKMSDIQWEDEEEVTDSVEESVESDTETEAVTEK